jgi:hypothetical protein
MTGTARAANPIRNQGLFQCIAKGKVKAKNAVAGCLRVVRVFVWKWDKRFAQNPWRGKLKHQNLWLLRIHGLG